MRNLFVSLAYHSRMIKTSLWNFDVGGFDRQQKKCLMSRYVRRFYFCDGSQPYI